MIQKKAGNRRKLTLNAVKEDKKEKLQKILANAGLASRRAMEEWIAAGRIRVNGKVAVLGDRASINDRISIDGKVIHLSKQNEVRKRVLLFHKPEGLVCTRDDPEGRPTIFDKMPTLGRGRWITIGRLDINTAGLLLLTTDGDLAHRMMHPSFQIEREYAVRVVRELPPDIIKQLQEGVQLEDGIAHFGQIVDAGGTGMNHWYHVTLTEGRNREVRRLFDTVGITLNRLIRIRYGNVMLPRTLPKGHMRELTREEVAQLIRTVQ
jgi:23S rRNA pseudouridine2605 synthase